MLSFVESSSHFSVIEPEDALRWAYSVDRYRGQRGGWHANRLGGIGGSEMGAIVSHYRGRRHEGFQTLAHIVEGKLMNQFPAFETFHMRRGNELVKLSLQAYLFKTGATLDVELPKKGAEKNTLEIYERLAAARFGASISEEQMAEDEVRLDYQPEPAFEPFQPIEMETGHLSDAFAGPAPAAQGTENQPIPMRASPGLN